MLLWLSALAPIAVILILMLGLRQGGDRAGLAGWLTAVLLAAAAFGAGPRVLWVAQGKALLLAAYVLYIIWMALLFYHTLNEAGAVRAIGAGLASLTPNRDIQALLLSWAFGSFLQGVSGYGVPTAVVAPLMVAVGFDASAAVVAAGLGHAWAVTFGSLSASFQALIAASGRTGPELAPSAALLLSVACLACGLVVLWVSGGPRAVRQSWGFVLVIGLLMGAAQYLLAWAGLYSIAAIGAGLVGLGAASLLAHRWRPAAGPAQADGVQATTAPVYPAPAAIRPMPLRLALLPYGLLVVGIGLTEFVPAIGGVLDALTVRVGFPAAETARGYATPAEAGRTISLFGHPGALLLYATLVIAWIYARRGRYEPGAGARIRRGVLKGALLPSVGILSMVA
ncbi:MAG: L-lactate permease, partial [Anaerolineales bacterium]|nr:L-lactate permease [Anaerolineales bacterium]